MRPVEFWTLTIQMISWILFQHNLEMREEGLKLKIPGVGYCCRTATSLDLGSVSDSSEKYSSLSSVMIYMKSISLCSHIVSVVIML